MNFNPAAVTFHDACQSCGAREPGWEPRFSKRGLYTCARCGSFSFFSNDAIDPSSLYSQEYFNGGEYRDYVGHQKTHEINFAKKLRILKSLSNAPLRIFEVGCAYGLFVNYARRSGVEKAFGVDVSADAIAFAKREFGPHFEISSDSPKPPFSYNCLVAWDVWEHLEKPVEFFSRCVAGLEKGGIVAFTTVDSSSLVARLRGERWRQIHPPTHLHYPTRAGIKSAMKAMGLSVLYHSHFGVHRALESYLAPFGLDGLVKGVTALRTLPVPLDLRDIQLIVAKKE